MHLGEVFQCLEAHVLIVNPAKCQLGLSVIDFFGGHHILVVVPWPAKVQTVKEFPRPVVIKALQEFLGIIFYIFFIARAPHLLHLVTGADCCF